MMPVTPRGGAVTSTHYRAVLGPCFAGATQKDLIVSSPSYARNAIVLGLLSAVGPFAIDMYLPALPSIAADLKASTAATQMTLMAFFMAFGVCQLVYGPLSDVIGRKPPLYAGLALFIVGSIGCALAPSVEWLIAASVRSVLRCFGELLVNPRFLGLAFIGGFGMASFFAFLASSSFIYIGHYGLTPTQYSFGFSINAFGFIGASQFAATLGRKFGLSRVVMTAAAIFTFFALLLLGVTLAGVDSLAVLIALLFLGFAFLGLVIPTTMVLTLEEHGPIAGIASSLAGTLQMVAGGGVIALASLFFDGHPLPMVTIIAVCACCALLLSLMTLRRDALAPQLAE